MRKEEAKLELGSEQTTLSKIKEVNHTPSNGEKSNIRFSDEELKEFKKLISLKLKKTKTEYEILKEALTLKGDNGTNDTSPTFKLLEDGADASSKEETTNHAIRLQKYIVHLQNALIRIENKTYGICSVTGKLISKERLRSVPHTTLSLNAKLGIPD